MRLLLIANTLPPADVSGVGEQVLQLEAGLAAAGHQVEVLGRGHRRAKVLFPLTVVPAVWAKLRSFRPDVVQVHESDGALAALLVRLLRTFSRLRSLPSPRLFALLQVSYVEERRAVRPLTAPDGRLLGRPGAVERRFRRGKARLQVLLGRWTARLADRVLAPSRVTAGEIERDYGVADVRVVPNVTGGLAVEPAPLPEPAAALPAGEAFLFVGRLRIRKGVEVLFEALAALRAEGHEPRLLVAGDGEHRAALEAKAAELALGDAVVFLGTCTAGEVRTLLSHARALVVPSTYEGMPLVVLEAMEAGLPVVASAVSGIPEVVVDGAVDGAVDENTGWLVPAEDPAALAAALADLLADPAEAARRGAAGRARVEARYRPADAARSWLEAAAGSTEGRAAG